MGSTGAGSSTQNNNERSPVLNDNPEGSSSPAGTDDLTMWQHFSCWIRKIWDRLRAFVGLGGEPTFRGMGLGQGGKGSNPPPRPPKGGPKKPGPKKPGCVIM